jgi:hypothetical protein
VSKLDATLAAWATDESGDTAERLSVAVHYIVSSVALAVSLWGADSERLGN